MQNVRPVFRSTLCLLVAIGLFVVTHPVDARMSTVVRVKMTFSGCQPPTERITVIFPDGRERRAAYVPEETSWIINLSFAQGDRVLMPERDYLRPKIEGYFVSPSNGSIDEEDPDRGIYFFDCRKLVDVKIRTKPQLGLKIGYTVNSRISPAQIQNATDRTEKILSNLDPRDASIVIEAWEELLLPDGPVECKVLSTQTVFVDELVQSPSRREAFDLAIDQNNCGLRRTGRRLRQQLSNSEVSVLRERLRTRFKELIVSADP